MKNCDNTRHPTFLLFGIGGVFNYGCEAIVRGTEYLLHRCWPDAVIRYAAFEPDRDSNRLNDLPIEVVYRKKVCRNSYRRCLAYAVNIVSPSILLNQEDLSILHNVDTVLSIGGDLYTFNAQGKYPRALMAFGDACIRNRRKYVLWGASVGPFTSVPRVEKVVAKHLRRITSTIVREPVSGEYLSSIGVNNYTLFPDPAFFVAPEVMQDPARVPSGVYGVNLSPLSLRYSRFSGVEVQDHQVRTLAAISRNLGVKFLLLPHVVTSHSKGDDDLRYLRSLAEKLSNEIGADKVALVDNDPGFVGIKKHLLNCDALIASRMHCAINALSAGVPTFFLSYSAKARGMAEFVYGNNRWVTSQDAFIQDAIIGQMQAFHNNTTSLRQLLHSRKNQILAQAEDQLTTIANLIG